MTTELEIRTFGYDPELEIRAGGDGRTVTGLVAPWDIEITATGAGGRGVIREVLRQGALDKSVAERGDKIPLTFYHPDPTNPFADRGIIGRAIKWENSASGQRASFKVADTPRGNEALTMIREGLIADFSIGFKGVHDRTKVVQERGKAPLYERYEVNLDHVALVPNGAYPNALVEQVRAEFDPDNEELAPGLAIARKKLAVIFL